MQEVPPGPPEQVPRLERYRRAHPDVDIQPPGDQSAVWRAFRDGDLIAYGFTLMAFLDRLEVLPEPLRYFSAEDRLAGARLVSAGVHGHLLTGGHGVCAKVHGAVDMPPLSYRGRMTAWGNLPSAPPPHGTVLAWARGCRCEECECEYKRFVSELALRAPLRIPAQPEPRKMDADTLARLEPAVSQSECPVCGARRHQRCRNLAFPQHFAPTHPERKSGP